MIFPRNPFPQSTSRGSGPTRRRVLRSHTYAVALTAVSSLWGFAPLTLAYPGNTLPWDCFNRSDNQFVRGANSDSSNAELQCRPNPDLPAELPEDFDGIPLFYGASGEEVLTVSDDGNRVVPMFFAAEDLRNTIASIENSNPELASDLSVDVTTLGEVLEVLGEGVVVEDENLDGIIFIPSREVLEKVEE